MIINFLLFQTHMQVLNYANIEVNYVLLHRLSDLNQLTLEKKRNTMVPH